MDESDLKPWQRTALTAFSLVGGLLFLLVAASILGLIVVYVFGLGGWRLFGVTLVAMASYALRAAVYVALFYMIVAKPGHILIMRSSLTGTLRQGPTGLADKDRHELDFARRFTSSLFLCELASALLVGLIALLAHDSLMGAIGNPLTDVITLAVVGFAPNLIASFADVVLLSKYKNEDPQLYQQFMSEL